MKTEKGMGNIKKEKEIKGIKRDLTSLRRRRIKIKRDKI